MVYDLKPDEEIEKIIKKTVEEVKKIMPNTPEKMLEKVKKKLENLKQDETIKKLEKVVLVRYKAPELMFYVSNNDT